MITKPFKEEIIYIWWPNLVSAFWSSLILGAMAFGALRLVIKLGWLDGVDERSYRSLQFQFETASTDIGKATSKAQGILDKVSAHPAASSLIGKSKDASKKLRNEFSNIGSNVPQELGFDAHRCPFCGWPEFDNKGCCKKCENQVRKIPKPIKGQVCSQCGRYFLSIAGVNFCYSCGKFLHNQYEEAHPSSDASRHDKESLTDLSDNEILAPIFPGMEEID